MSIPAAVPIGSYAVAFSVALLGAVLLTPLVRDIALAGNLVDSSDGDRKLHDRPVPRIGGVAVVLGLGIALLALYGDAHLRALRLPARLEVVLLGGLAMHLLGLVDDVFGMRARWKLLAQAIIASGVCAAGVNITVMSLPGLPEFAVPPALGAVLTVTWLVGVTNAFNLIDGVDGLAGGAALFPLLAMTAIGAAHGQWVPAWITLSLAGALCGFLVFNFPPASVFLGDSGSLFLGFMLAGLGLLSAEKTSTAVVVALPLVALGLPVLDLTLAVARRFLRRQAIFTPDRGHIHHRLLNRGFTPRRVTLTLYGVSATLSAVAMVLVMRPGSSGVLLVLLGIGLVLFIHQLRFDEFEELAGTLVRAAAQRGNIERAVRIREGSVRMAQLTDLASVFGALSATLEQVGFARAQVRLRRGFTDRAAAVRLADVRESDELTVWSWGSDEVGDATWQVCLPLCAPDGHRIGTLAIWQEMEVADQSLSYWRALALYLCREVERKVAGLWHSDTAAALLADKRLEPVREFEHEHQLLLLERPKGPAARSRPAARS